VRPGRLALLLTSAAYVVTLAWAAVLLPDPVPSHFDAAGRVDGWMSRTSLLVVAGVIGLVVLVGIPALTRALTAGDGTWINIPQASKDYWLAPQRRDEFRVRFGDDIEVLTALTGVLLTAVLALTTWVGSTGRDAVPWWVFIGITGIYLALTAVWTVRLLRAYRPPSAP
jgi:hypothetical protein